MKKIYSILASLLLTASLCCTQQATAQAPQKMSYQSVLRNSSNVLLANTQVRIKISVLQGTASGTAVYVETQLATTNGNGLLSLQIGTGPVTTGTFAAINWAAGPYFIKTETDPTGGTNYTITGTQEMLSVPYAMYATKSGDSTTMGAIGGSSTANGGSITAGVLRLTPADATNGGLVTTNAQTFAGSKTFSSAITITAGAPGAGKVLTSDAAGLAGWANSRGFEHYLGENYGGGIIFHLWKDASNTEHGLIVSVNELSTSVWCNVNGPFSTSYWDGYSNSIIIAGTPGHTSSAAALCLNLLSGNQSDWYLPAVDELNILMINRFNVNKTLSEIGGNQVGRDYWSSTSENNVRAYVSMFNSLQEITNDPLKTDILRVRAIRAF